MDKEERRERRERRRERRRIRRIGRLLVLIALCYVFIVCFDYAVPPKVSNEFKDSFHIEEYYADETGVDRVTELDDATQRLNEILLAMDAANNTLDISYFFVKDSVTTSRIIGAVLCAADRGVKVRMIVDGIKCGFTSDMGYALGNHENIEIAFYNPIDILKPRQLMSRLHDKYIISDDRLLIMGGGNIDDVYLNATGRNGSKVDDRMAVVYNTAYGTDNQDSVIFDVKAYMDEMWNSENVRIEYENTKDIEQMAQAYREEYLEWKAVCKEDFNPETYDFYNETVPTDKITLIHNETYAGVKEPTAEYIMTQLMGAANDKVIMETPYIIADDEIYTLLLNLKEKGTECDVLLSSAANVPFVDIFLFATYCSDKPDLLAAGANLYEYQRPEYKHSKTYIIDDEMTLIGSYNLCFHSYVYNTDVMLAVDSKEFAAQTESSALSYMQNSCLVGENGQYEENGVQPSIVPGYKSTFINIIKYPLHLFRWIF